MKLWGYEAAIRGIFRKALMSSLRGTYCNHVSGLHAVSHPINSLSSGSLSDEGPSPHENSEPAVHSKALTDQQNIKRCAPSTTCASDVLLLCAGDVLQNTVHTTQQS